MRALAIMAALLAVSIVATSTSAHEVRVKSIVVEHPWARATTPAQKTGAVYMVIRNSGDAPDRLIGARSGESRSAMVHDSTVTAEGVAKMREADSVEIPAGGEARLAPSGLHVMLAGLKGPLFEGVSFPMTLVFERAGEFTVEVEVMGGSSMPHEDGGQSSGAGDAAQQGAHGN